MGKLIFWVVVVFVVLLGLRMFNVAQQRRHKGRAAPPPADTGESMVRCVRCGVFLPRSEALLVDGKARCRDKDCT